MTQYGTGPASGTGADVSESGVHTMTLNWFTDGHLILVVHHKNTLLNCYFDMALDPGHVVADLCTKQQTVIPTRVTAIAGMKVTAEGQQVGGQRRTSIGMSILHGNTYTGQLFTRQYLRVSQVNLRASRFHNRFTSCCCICRLPRPVLLFS